MHMVHMRAFVYARIPCKREVDTMAFVRARARTLDYAYPHMHDLSARCPGCLPFGVYPSVSL